jgi:hypothetical protein
MIVSLGQTKKEVAVYQAFPILFVSDYLAFFGKVLLLPIIMAAQAK